MSATDEERFEIFVRGIKEGKAHSEPSGRTLEDMKETNGKIAHLENSLGKIETLLEGMVRDFRRVIDIDTRVVRLETKASDTKENQDMLNKEFKDFAKAADEEHRKIRDEMGKNRNKIGWLTGKITGGVAVVALILSKLL